MKRLELLPEHNTFIECFIEGAPQQYSAFSRKVLNNKFFSEKSPNGELVRISADNYRTSNFERAFMFFKERCPTWPEMVELKNFLWDKNEIVFQVHPRKEEYVNSNKTALHLWKTKDAKSQKAMKHARILILLAMLLLRIAPNSSELRFKDGQIFQKRYVAIFGGNAWPTWEEVCSIKQHCFGENRTALQFNISSRIDLNPEHVLFLWDAEDFEIKLPPKELV